VRIKRKLQQTKDKRNMMTRLFIIEKIWQNKIIREEHRMRVSENRPLRRIF
jgi:hypothetical protein